MGWRTLTVSSRRWVAFLLIAMPVAAAAHFQLIFTPTVLLEKAGTVTLDLVFWHPLENGEVMAMERPREFYYVHKGKRHSLMDALRPITFKGKDNSAQAFTADVPFRRVGDYTLVVVPEPYFESSEDIYIQQVTKMYVNRAGIPSGWDEPLGLAAEIIPLVWPTNVVAGSTFTGRVMSDGKPVAGAELEIEYLPAPVSVTEHRVETEQSAMPAAGAIQMRTDANGYFTFGVPRAGLWGVAALGVGPVREHNGKELSQDAVIWFSAFDLP